MLINFRQGIIQAGQSPLFLSFNGSTGNVDLIASQLSPVFLDFANGADDYLFQELNNVPSAWSGLPSIDTVYLYWDINIKTAVRTFGFTTLPPIVSPTAPLTPATGQMWYNTTNFSQNFYGFGSWNPVLRVFAGTFTNGTIVANPLGTQIGIITPTLSGYILFDENNNPIKKYQTFNLGSFITTESPLASQFSQIQNYRLESIIDTATVSGDIAQWQAICYVSPGTIGIATSNVVLPPYGSGTPAIGIAPQNMPNGTVQSFLQEGYISDPSFNFSPVGANVFINTSGFLTTSPPNGGTLQVMGYVVDSQTVFISPQPAIIFG